MKEIKKWAADHKVLTSISVTVLFLFGLPLLIHLIVTLNWGIGFITPDNRDAWIGFYGAIIGGGITLGGVAWTIVEQRKQLKKQKIDFEEQRKSDLINQENRRREDLAIQYKPFIKTSFEEQEIRKIKGAKQSGKFTSGKFTSGFIAIGLDGEANMFYSLVLGLENCGDGECYLFAEDPKISGNIDTKTLGPETFKQYNLLKNSFIEKGWSISIPRNSKITFSIIINHDEMAHIKDKQLDISIPFVYCDQFQHSFYDANIRASILINFDNNTQRLAFSFAGVHYTNKEK